MKRFNFVKVVKTDLGNFAAVNDVGMVKLIDGTDHDLEQLQTQLNAYQTYINTSIYKNEQASILLNFGTITGLFEQGLSSYVILRHKITETLDVYFNGKLVTRSRQELSDLMELLVANTKYRATIPEPTKVELDMSLFEVITVGFVETPEDKWEVTTIVDTLTNQTLQLVDNVGIVEVGSKREAIEHIEKLKVGVNNSPLPTQALYEHLTRTRADFTLLPNDAGFYAVFAAGNTYAVGLNGGSPLWCVQTLEDAIQLGKGGHAKLINDGVSYRGKPVYVGFYQLNDQPLSPRPVMVQQPMMSPLHAFGMPIQPIKAKPDSKAVWDSSAISNVLGYVTSGKMNSEGREIPITPLGVMLESVLLRRQSQKAEAMPSGFALTEVAGDTLLLTCDSTGGKLWLVYKSPEQRVALLDCLSKVQTLDIVGENTIHYSKDILKAEPGVYWSLRDATICGGFTYPANFTVSEVMIQDFEGAPSISANK